MARWLARATKKKRSQKAASAVNVAITDWIAASGADTLFFRQCHEAGRALPSFERNLQSHCRTRYSVLSELLAAGISVPSAEAS